MALVDSGAEKAKQAKRVIEILEYFGAGRQPATVMEIARHFGRPQSSTSELLRGLVNMGILYRDTPSLKFSLTPRIASLGSMGQSEVIRNGCLFNYMDKLAKTTRKTVALFGTVGMHVQIFHVDSVPYRQVLEIGNGMKALLTSSTVGQLLLSVLSPKEMQGRVWRLNSEACDEEKFDFKEMVERVASFGLQGYSSGKSGFISNTYLSAILLPQNSNEHPLALGIFYPESSACDADTYVATLKHIVSQIFSCENGHSATDVTSFVRAV
jgi:DNA-binding IclR family transcriptional regulator